MSSDKVKVDKKTVPYSEDITTLNHFHEVKKIGGDSELFGFQDQTSRFWQPINYLNFNEDEIFDPRAPEVNPIIDFYKKCDRPKRKKSIPNSIKVIKP